MTADRRTLTDRREAFRRYGDDMGTKAEAVRHYEDMRDELDADMDRALARLAEGAKQ